MNAHSIERGSGIGDVITRERTHIAPVPPVSCFMRGGAGAGGADGAGSRAHPPAVERLEPRQFFSAGALDPTFGAGGEVTSTLLRAADAAVQADGKVVVAGGKVGRNGVPDLALARFNADGSVDGSFGSGGIVVAPVFINGTLEAATATAVAVLPGGKILVAGRAAPLDSGGEGDVVVARYNADGSSDPTFGDHGLAHVPVGAAAGVGAGGGEFGTGGMAVLGDGAVVVDAFIKFPGPSPRVGAPAVFSAAGRPDGVYDPAMEDGGGILPPGLVPTSVAALPGNLFVLAGSHTSGAEGPSSQAYAILSESGVVAVNPSAGNGPVSPAGDAETRTVAGLPDGRFYLAGASAGTTPSGQPADGFTLSRYAGDRIDATFNGGNQPFGPGTVVTPVNGGPALATAVALQPDGKVLVAGDAPRGAGGPSTAFALVRYQADGSLDAGFAAGGVAVTNVGGSVQHVEKVLVLPGGGIVLLGSADGKIVLVRYQGGPAAPPPAASVSGTVFNDRNGDGRREAGEAGLAGVRVYADLTNSGAYRVGDPAATTNSSGHYTLSGLPAGSAIIRQVPPGGYRQTLPFGNLGRHLTLCAGQPISGQDFGDKA